MRLHGQILLILIFVSCTSKDNKSNLDPKDSILHADTFSFLNYILTDTTEIRLVKDGRKVILDIDILGPANFKENFSDYLSEELNEKDIAYINRQLKESMTFKTDELTKYGFTVVKASELVERKISADRFWNKIENGITCGSGEDFIIELIDNKWVITKRLDGWVS